MDCNKTLRKSRRVLIAFLSLAGLTPNMNVNSMDMTGGLSVKDPSQSQSRLPQWTHPNPMDNLPGAASPLDQNPSKHGMSEPGCMGSARSCRAGRRPLVDCSCCSTHCSSCPRIPVERTLPFHPRVCEMPASARSKPPKPQPPDLCYKPGRS